MSLTDTASHSLKGGPQEALYLPILENSGDRTWPMPRNRLGVVKGVSMSISPPPTLLSNVCPASPTGHSRHTQLLGVSIPDQLKSPLYLILHNVYLQ